jgi:hypothetical protein
MQGACQPPMAERWVMGHPRVIPKVSCSIDRPASPCVASALPRMPSHILRRLSKAQLLDRLRRRSAAPFHVIIWDGRPVRLADALTLLERAEDDSYYYATPDRVIPGAPAPN